MGVIRRDEPEKPHKDDPPCTCGCKAIIDVNRHDWRCARRLWIERNDARGAVGLLRAAAPFVVWPPSTPMEERERWASAVAALTHGG